jgi:hypothetical protein
LLSPYQAGNPVLVSTAPADGAASDPNPARSTAVGPSGSSEVTVSVPVRTPAAVGVNCTVIRQVPPGTTGFVQPLSVTSKSPSAAAPATFRSAPPPTLVTVTCSSWLGRPTCRAPKSSEPGRKPMSAVEVPPMPASGITSGSFWPVCRTVRCALRVPVPLGVKVTDTVHVPAAASAWSVQVSVPGATAKSASCGPSTAMAEMVSGESPALARVTSTGAEVAPWATLAKSTAAGSDSSGPANRPITLNWSVRPMTAPSLARRTSKWCTGAPSRE